MALNTVKCDCLMPLHFKGLKVPCKSVSIDWLADWQVLCSFQGRLRRLVPGSDVPGLVRTSVVLQNCSAATCVLFSPISRRSIKSATKFCIEKNRSLRVLPDVSRTNARSILPLPAVSCNVITFIAQNHQ